MKLSKFKFNLPDELIASFPTEHRDESRLMIVHRKTGQIEHNIFKDLIDIFNEKDVLIFNQFEEFGNAIWHYNMTGGAIEELYENHFKTATSRMASYVSATGSAGTIAAGDYLPLPGAILATEIGRQLFRRARPLLLLLGLEHHPGGRRGEQVNLVVRLHQTLEQAQGIGSAGGAGQRQGDLLVHDVPCLRRAISLS